MKRGAGILMPIFSLPSEEKFATLGECAYKFVDFLAKSHQIYWQVLPINETDDLGSPFCSTCINSGNPLFIDLKGFVSDMDLKKLSKEKVKDFKEYKNIKMKLLFKVFKNNNFKEEVDKFVNENEWVIPYSEFMTIKEKYNTISSFPKELKDINSFECRKFIEKNNVRKQFYMFCQYLFFKQWYELKKYANEKGILIIGDSPCNSSMDSKEAWADKEMYLLDEELAPTFVAGVPPDYFSSTGQVWNTLIYNYEVIKENGYKYLLDKYKYLLNVYDFVKIDHFRGLECFYKIPYGEIDGKNGEWIMGPGYEYIDLLRNNGINNLILEDLGIISEGVVRLKEYSGYPGMKVYEFAFGEENSPFLPRNYIENCVAYTGTHDNDTLYSFLSNKEDRILVNNYLKIEESSSAKKTVLESIKALYFSIADVVIINPQDLLMQSSKYRFNTPGTVKGNWTYCCNEKIYSKDNVDFLSNLAIETKRRG